MDVSQYLEIFIDESAEHLQTLSDCIMELEKEPEPTSTTPPAPTDPRLPYTGQLNWPVPVLTVLGLGLLALGLARRRKSRHG